MEDLINRSDAIKWFEPYADRGLKIPVETVIQNLKDIPSAEKQGEWIPCSERLPEENGKSYLTYQCGDDIRYGWCQVLRYDDGWNCLNGDKSNEIRRVVAWTPLPKPWKGAE